MMNVLVVDDQTGILRSINRLLSRLGYNCRMYVSPQVALEEFDPVIHDAVVCDFQMPEMRGDEFLRRLLERCPDARVIVMSGYASEDEARDLLSQGAYAFLDKPLDIERLLRLLRELEQKKEA